MFELNYKDTGTRFRAFILKLGTNINEQQPPITRSNHQ